MKRNTLLLLLLPTCSFAGTSDPGGIATGILWLLVLGFCLWVVFALGIGVAPGRSARWRTSIAVGVAIAPLAYCGLTSYQYDSGLDNLRSLNERLTSSADSYLTQKCEQERSLLSVRPVAPSDGVLIEVDTEQRLGLKNVPPSPQETARMRLDQKRYGESYPVATHQLQYERPVYWVRQMYADSVLVASRFAFVESGDRRSSGSPLRSTARKRWWLDQGQSQVPAARRQELERRLADMPETDNYWLSQPVTSSQAKYLLSVHDISTTEDRKHWVARARMVLTHRETGEVVAEYVGFASNQTPAYQTRESYPWERSKVCPGKEQNYQRDRAPWDVVGFFFREVVVYQ